MTVPFLDSHIHLFPPEKSSYGYEKFKQETSESENILGAIYIECDTAHYKSGPISHRPLGETQWVAAVAEKANAVHSNPQIFGIVSHLDLTLDKTIINDLIKQHQALGNGLFKGIRHRAAYSEIRELKGHNLLESRQNLYINPAFQAGVDTLGENDLTFEAWNYHDQTGQLLECVKACPDTTFILNHFCSPIGIGEYAGKQDQIYPEWAMNIERIAQFDNVIAKLGGLSMPLNGWGWDTRGRKASCEELMAAQINYYRHTIECFGTDRCMFESNFPVDRLSTSYGEVVKFFRTIASEYPQRCQHKMLHQNSKKYYQIDSAE